MSLSQARANFWNFSSYVVIGNSARKPFPKLTYRGLKKLGKTVFPIDPKEASIEGDPAFSSLAQLPRPVEAAVLELPNDETAHWVQQVARAGIKAAWIHEDTDTPEAISVASQLGLEIFTGRCAVMYLQPHEFPHSFHRWLLKIFKKL